MITILKLVLLRWFATKTLGGALAVLGTIALPLAALLKIVGLPLLAVLGVVALPVALVLGIIGLPILLVVGAVGVVTAVIGGVLAFGLMAIKIALPIVAIFWVVRWIVRRVRTPKPVDTVGAAI